MPNTVTLSISSKNEEYRIKTWHLFAFLTALNLLIAFVFNKYVMTRELYYSLFSSQVESSRIDEFVDFANSRILVINSLIIPVFLWIKITFVAFLIQFPLLVMDVEIGFKNVFRGVMFANYVYVAMTMVKMVWIEVMPIEKITNESITVNPLALTNLIDFSLYSKASFMLLNNVNVFEVGWIVFLVLFLKTKGSISSVDAILVVLIVWVVLLFGQYGLVYYFTQIF